MVEEVGIRAFLSACFIYHLWDSVLLITPGALYSIARIHPTVLPTSPYRRLAIFYETFTGYGLDDHDPSFAAPDAFLCRLEKANLICCCAIIHIENLVYNTVYTTARQ